MKVNLTIPIECGIDTCTSKPGNFCEWFGSKKFGQQPYCCLFDGELFPLDGNYLGWTERCRKCKEVGK